MASTDTFLNLSQGLAGNIKDANKEMNSFNDLSQSINKTFNDTNKALSSSNDLSQKVNDSFDDISDSAEGTKEHLGDWGKGLNLVFGNLKKIAGIFAAMSFTGGLIDAVQDTFNLHQAMTDLSYRMGDAGKSAGQLNQAIINTQLATGKSTEEVQKMVETLGYLRVASGDMQQLATDTMNFSTITGVGQDQAAQFAGQLSLMGGLGAKSISSIMGGMVQVQRQFGMSTESANALTGGIVETTKVLRTLGKSSSDIERFQSGTIKLAGAFESVGLEATKATEIIDRLLDPSKLEDNALLYSKLGISIEDAISGNINPEDIMQGLQGIGAELSNMAGPQAAALASSMGMSLTELRQMSQMDVSQISEQFGLAADASSMMGDAMGDQQTSTKTMQQTWEKIKGTIANLLEKFMPIFDSLANVAASLADNFLGMFNGFISNGGLEKITGAIAGWVDKIPALVEGITGFLKGLDPKVLLLGVAAVIGGFLMMKKKFASVSTDNKKQITQDFTEASHEISQVLSEGVSGGLEMAAEKSAEVMKAKMKSVGLFASDEFKNRVREGMEYGAMDAASSYQKVLADQDTFGWAKALNAGTAKWLDTVKEGGRPLSLLAQTYKTIQGRLSDNYSKAKEQWQGEIEFLDARQQRNRTDVEAMVRRINTLEEIGSKMSDSEKREMAYLLKRKEVLDKEYSFVESKTKEVHALQMDAIEKRLKRIGPNERAEMRETQNMVVNGIQNELKERQKVQDQKQNELDLLNITQKETSKMLADLRQRNDLSADEVVRMNELMRQEKENRILQEQINDELAAGNTEIDSMTNKLSQAEEELALMQKHSKGIDYNPNEAEFKSVFGKITSIVGAKWQETIMSPVADFSDKFKKSISNTKSAFKDAFSADGFKGAVNLLRRGVVSAGANLLKSAGKAGIGLAKKVGGASVQLGKAALNAGKELAGKLGKAAGSLAKGAAKGLALGGAGLLMGAIAKSEAGQKLMEKLSGVMSNLMEGLGPTIEKLMPVVDKLVASLGPIIEKIGAFIGEMIEKLMPMIEPLLAKVMPILTNVMNAIMPVLSAALEAIMPIAETMLGLFMDLVGSLLPAIMPLFNMLLDLMVPLIKALLPPLLVALGWVTKTIGFLITAIGGLLEKLGMKEFGATIKEVGDGITATGDAMLEASKNFKSSAEELRFGLTEAAREQRLSNQYNKVNARVNAALNDTLGITTEQAIEMSNKELATQITNMDNRSQLTDTLAENVIALRDSIAANKLGEDLEAVTNAVDNLSDNATAFDAVAMGQKLSWLSGDSNMFTKDAADQLGDNLSARDLGEIWRSVQGGSTTEEIMASFGDEIRAAGGNQDALESMLERLMEKQDQINVDSSTAFTQAIRESMITPMEELMRNPYTEVEYDNTALIEGLRNQGLTINEGMEKAIQEFGIDAVNAMKNGDNERLSEMLLQVNSDRYTQSANTDVIEQFERRMLALAGDNKEAKIQVAEIIESMNREAARGTGGAFGTEEAMKKYLAEQSAETIAMITRAQSLSVEDTNRLLESVNEELNGINDNTTPRDEGEVVTRLYPAIVDAASSGFVESEDARAVTSGGTPEERQVEVSERIYEGIMQLVGINEEGNGHIIEQAQAIAEQAAIARQREASEALDR